MGDIRRLVTLSGGTGFVSVAAVRRLGPVAIRSRSNGSIAVRCSACVVGLREDLLNLGGKSSNVPGRFTRCGELGNEVQSVLDRTASGIAARDRSRRLKHVCTRVSDLADLCSRRNGGGVNRSLGMTRELHTCRAGVHGIGRVFCSGRTGRKFSSGLGRRLSVVDGCRDRHSTGNGLLVDVRRLVGISRCHRTGR